MTAEPPADGPARRPLVPAPLSGVAVDLVPVTEESYGYLYDLATHPEVSVRWRYHGTVPNRDTFFAEIWAGIFAQLLVVDRASHERAGLVVAYQGNLRNGSVWMAAVSDPRFQGQRTGIEGSFLFANYLIRTWPFRKIYFEIPEFNLDQFGSGLGRFWHEEGRFKEELYYDGQYWDVVTVALYRDELDAHPLFRRAIEAARRAASRERGG